MNILQLQDNLKNFSQDQLIKEMQMPSGQVPQFLVLSELDRRKRVNEDFQAQQAANQPTVAQETVAAAGVPQGGVTDMARAMAPKTSMVENTGIGALLPKQPTRMADGGVVKMAMAGPVLDQDQKAALIAALKQRLAVGRDYDRDMYIRALGEDAVREAESAIFNQGLAGGIGPASQARMYKQGIFGRPKMSTEEAIAARRAIAGTPEPELTYEKGTGRATMVDGVVVEVMPDGKVYNVATGEEVSESVAAKAIEKLTPDIAADTATKEAAKVPTLYDTSIGMPTQEDLNLKAQEPPAPDVFTDVSAFDMDAAFNEEQDLKKRRADAAAVENIDPKKPTFTGDVLPFLTGAADDVVDGLGFEIAPNDNLDPYSGKYGTDAEGNPITDQSVVQSKIASLTKRLEDPNLTETERKYIENGLSTAQASLNSMANAAELPSWLGQKVDETVGGMRSTVDPILGGALSYFSPDTAIDFANSSDNAQNFFATKAAAEQQAREARLAAAGVTTSEKPAPSFKVGDSSTPTPELSFGTGEADKPMFAPQSDLSFGKTAEDAKKKAEEKKAAEEKAKSAASTGGAGSGAKGAGAAGGIEGQLAQMLKDMEKSREQDKWLAIAQIGAEMMKPTATFGEGIGNAISKGTDAMREGKKQYSQDKLTILALQQKIDAAKLAAASRGSSSTKIPPATLLTAAQSEVNRLTTALANATTPAERMALSEQLDAANAQRAALFSGITGYYPGLNLPSASTGSSRKQVN